MNSGEAWQQKHSGKTEKMIERTATCRAGESFMLTSGSAYELVSGALVMWAIHLDGSEAVTDFQKEGFLFPSQDPLFYFRCEALLDCSIKEISLASGICSPDFREKLLLQQVDLNGRLRVWMANQLRLSVEDRLLGVFHLLADDFGFPGARGVTINLPLTHRILAAATGSTRATITRTVGRLVLAKRLKLVGEKGNRKYVLLSSAQPGI